MKRNTQCFFLTVKIAHNQKEGTLYWLPSRDAAPLQVRHHRKFVTIAVFTVGSFSFLEHSNGEGESYTKKRRKRTELDE
ncbi:hypothetical protein DKP78_16770, partial [Enterococcus faecium]